MLYPGEMVPISASETPKIYHVIDPAGFNEWPGPQEDYWTFYPPTYPDWNANRRVYGCGILFETASPPSPSLP